MVTCLVSQRSTQVLLAVVALFLALRLPAMYRQFGGQDEDYYAVPGWAILHEGVPRIPYVPSRDLAGVFYKADVALYALPPAYFYWQAAVYAVFGPGYGAARLASAFAGVAAVGLVYYLGRRWYDERTGLAAAGLYSFSRLFFFPATMARPDMLCAAFGLGALALFDNWNTNGRRSGLVAAGAAAGLGLLTHPFAIVYCLQMGVWCFFGSGSWRQRVTAAAILTTVAAAVLVLGWLPLIRLHPDVFAVQFHNNVLDRAGPGIVGRFLFPWTSLAVQSRQFIEWSGRWQSALLLCGFVGALWRDFFRAGGPRRALVLAASSVWLLMVCQGDHPAKGYWCYPGALLFLLLARGAVGLSVRPRHGLAALLGAIVLVMVPGSGIRTWWQYLRHWSDPNYNAPAFVQRLLADLPAEGRYLVDVSYVLDFYLAERDVTLALNIAPYFEAAGRPYDYLVVGPTGLRQNLPEQLSGRRLRTYGVANDEFACYAKVFRPD